MNVENPPKRGLSARYVQRRLAKACGRRAGWRRSQNVSKRNCSHGWIKEKETEAQSHRGAFPKRVRPSERRCAKGPGPSTRRCAVWAAGLQTVAHLRVTWTDVKRVYVGVCVWKLGENSPSPIVTSWVTPAAKVPRATREARDMRVRRQDGLSPSAPLGRESRTGHLGTFCFSLHPSAGQTGFPSGTRRSVLLAQYHSSTFFPNQTRGTPGGRQPPGAPTRLHLRNPLLALTLKLRGRVDLNFLVHCDIQMSEFRSHVMGHVVTVLTLGEPHLPHHPTTAAVLSTKTQQVASLKNIPEAKQ